MGVVLFLFYCIQIVIYNFYLFKETLVNSRNISFLFFCYVYVCVILFFSLFYKSIIIDSYSEKKKTKQNKKFKKNNK